MYNIHRTMVAKYVLKKAATEKSTTMNNTLMTKLLIKQLLKQIAKHYKLSCHKETLQYSILYRNVIKH